jgi:hypothetical protein
MQRSDIDQDNSNGPVDQKVKTPSRIGAVPNPADSEAGNGLSRSEEALQEAAEGEVRPPDKEKVPVFDRGDLPPDA